MSIVWQMKKVSITVAVFTLFFLSVTFSFGAEKTHILPLPSTIQDSIPWFAVRELAPNNPPFTKVHLQKIAQKSNRIAFVYFATWCVPCRAGIKNLAQNHKDLEKNDIKVVLVNVGERDEELIKKWKSQMDIPNWIILLDPFGRTTEGFELIKEGTQMDLPKTLVLDKNLKPLQLIGEEGSDFIETIKK